MPDTPATPDPLAGLSPHDWPGIVDRLVAAVRGGAAFRAYVSAIAAGGDADLSVSRDGDEPRAARVHAAQDALLAATDRLGLGDGGLRHEWRLRAGLVARLWEAASTEAGRPTPRARNPFPVRFDAALLAGGSGTRIGGGKAFVPLGGRPLAAWAAAAAGRYAERLLVVARTVPDAEAVAEAVAPFVAAPVVPVVDRPGAEGPVAGLLGAADAADGLLLTAPVDAPFLPDWAAFALHHGAVAATDRAHPTVLLAAAAHLRRLPPAGSLRATLAPLAPAEVPFPEAALFNVNTRADLAEAEARLARR